MVSIVNIQKRIFQQGFNICPITFCDFGVFRDISFKNSIHYCLYNDKVAELLESFETYFEYLIEFAETNEQFSSIVENQFVYYII